MPDTPGTARIVAIANQKGGVGKSTTAVSLGAALADLGYRVLVIDLDPQGNASTGLGIRHEARGTTVYDVVVGDRPILEAVVQTQVEQGAGDVTWNRVEASGDVEDVVRRAASAIDPLPAGGRTSNSIRGG